MKSNIKEKAIELRTSGFSLAVIARSLHIAKSTASVWLKDIVLDQNAKERIRGFKSAGLQKAISTNKKKRQLNLAVIEKRAVKAINQLPKTVVIDKLSLALLYWCEGEKSRNAVCFMNSDPQMVVTFLQLLRSSFELDEKKFRVCLHLHEYHRDLQEIEFWSKITAIPKEQFFKVYRKPNTGKSKKVNYRGCASVRYHDVNVVLELQSIWEHYSKKINGRVV